MKHPDEPNARLLGLLTKLVRVPKREIDEQEREYRAVRATHKQKPRKSKSTKRAAEG